MAFLKANGPFGCLIFSEKNAEGVRHLEQIEKIYDYSKTELQSTSTPHIAATMNDKKENKPFDAKQKLILIEDEPI